MNEKIEALEKSVESIKVAIEELSTKKEELEWRARSIEIDLYDAREEFLMAKAEFKGAVYNTCKVPYRSTRKVKDCFAVLVSETGSAHYWKIYIEAQRLGKPVVWMDGGAEVEILNKIWKGE